MTNFPGSGLDDWYIVLSGTPTGRNAGRQFLTLILTVQKGEQNEDDHIYSHALVRRLCHVDRAVLHRHGRLTSH